MHINRFLVLSLLISGLIISGCSKSSDKNTSDSVVSNGVSEDLSSEDTTIYTVTESEYTSIRNFFNSTDLLTEGNLTITGKSVFKFADCHLEFIDEENDIHSFYDFKYDAVADEYEIDEYSFMFDYWDVTHWKTNEYTLDDVLNLLNLGFYSMIESFAGLTYSEETHKYTGKYDDKNIEVSFENGKFVTYTFEYWDNGDYTETYNISNYGTTTINLPEVE